MIQQASRFSQIGGSRIFNLLLKETWDWDWMVLKTKVLSGRLSIYILCIQSIMKLYLNQYLNTKDSWCWILLILVSRIFESQIVCGELRKKCPLVITHYYYKLFWIFLDCKQKYWFFFLITNLCSQLKIYRLM